MAMRKRSGSGSKRQYKEKVLLIYESFFKGDEPTLTNPHFWDELFLLRPKVSHPLICFNKRHSRLRSLQTTV